MKISGIARATGMIVLTMLSLFCLVAIPGAFVQAVLLVYVLLVICGVLSVFGYLKIALLNIFILYIALAICPLSSPDQLYQHPVLALVTLASLAMAFLGLGAGIYKLQNKNAQAV